jgi:hypothetical protein
MNLLPYYLGCKPPFSVHRSSSSSPNKITVPSEHVFSNVHIKKKHFRLIRPRILHGNAVRHILPQILTPLIRALDPEHMPVVHRRNKHLL